MNLPFSWLTDTSFLFSQIGWVASFLFLSEKYVYKLSPELDSSPSASQASSRIQKKKSTKKNHLLIICERERESEMLFLLLFLFLEKSWPLMLLCFPLIRQPLFSWPDENRFQVNVTCYVPTRTYGLLYKVWRREREKKGQSDKYQIRQKCVLQPTWRRPAV